MAHYYTTLGDAAGTTVCNECGGPVDPDIDTACPSCGTKGKGLDENQGDTAAENQGDTGLRLWYYKNEDDDGEYGVVHADSVATAVRALGARFLDIYGPSVQTVQLIECDLDADTAVLPDLARQNLDICTCGRNMTGGAPHTADCELLNEDEE